MRKSYPPQKLRRKEKSQRRPPRKSLLDSTRKLHRPIGFDLIQAECGLSLARHLSQMTKPQGVAGKLSQINPSADWDLCYSCV
jgi:hypothetical protein